MGDPVRLGLFLKKLKSNEKIFYVENKEIITNLKW
jgi:hypothetical protein